MKLTLSLIFLIFASKSFADTQSIYSCELEDLSQTKFSVENPATVYFEVDGVFYDPEDAPETMRGSIYNERINDSYSVVVSVNPQIMVQNYLENIEGYSRPFINSVDYLFAHVQIFYHHLGIQTELDQLKVFIPISYKISFTPASGLILSQDPAKIAGEPKFIDAKAHPKKPDIMAYTTKMKTIDGRKAQARLNCSGFAKL